MHFKEWMFSEGFRLEYGPNATPYPLKVDQSKRPLEQPDPAKFEQFCRQAFMQYFGPDFQNAVARYDFVYTGVRDGYGEVILNFNLVPKGKSTPELATPDNDLYDFYQQHNQGRTGYNLFKTAQDAIEAIPDDPQSVYRGMAWEEWQYINRTGHVLSKGAYNIGQEGLTFYGDAGTALSYGSGFAPLAFKTSVKRPSVVIAIPRSLVMGHEDMPDKIPQDEFAHKDQLDSSHITAAYMLSPTKSKAGQIEFVFHWMRSPNGNEFIPSEVREGSRSNPTISYVLRKLK
jgi:hypothetical protein